MEMFKCTLVNSQGYQEQCFYRKGESAQDVKNGVEMFLWAEGEWKIEEVGEEQLELHR